MNKIAIVIVVYNQLLEQCTILTKNMVRNENTIFIVDNSTNALFQERNASYIKNKQNIEYISHKKNLGISKAYNIAIEEIAKGDFQYILLLDGDTQVANEYIEKIKGLICRKEVDLILPIIKTQGGKLLSPCKKQKYGFFSRFKSIDDIRQDENLSAINSGMCISRKIWDKYKYDENLFLDYVDHQFMMDFWKKNGKLHIMKDVVFIQNFSAESDDLEKAKIRYKIQINDIKHYLKKNDYARWCITLHICKRKIRLIAKNKKLDILFWQAKRGDKQC